MKQTILIYMLAGLVSAQAGGDGWLTDFEAAKKAAADRGVPILADFSGSDWCGWCIKLDKEVFSKEAFKTFAKDNVVLFLADFPARKEQPEALARQNKALASQYGVEGFPTVLLLDAEGKLKARTGYQRGGAEKYVEHLKELIRKI
jgi:thioredoxin-related protein